MPQLETSVMRTTLALDDDLVAKAQAFTGWTDDSRLAAAALELGVAHTSG